MIGRLWRTRHQPRGLIDVALERAVGAAGCPICGVMLSREDGSLWILLWENVNDPGIRAQIRRGLGFCPLHTVALCRIANEVAHDHVGVAILFADFMGEAALRLKTAGGLGELDKCVECRRGVATCETYLLRLADWFNREEPGLAAKAAGSLCVPHARGALQRSRGLAQDRLSGELNTALARAIDDQRGVGRQDPGSVLARLNGQYRSRGLWRFGDWRFGCPLCAMEDELESRAVWAVSQEWALGALDGLPCAQHGPRLLAALKPTEQRVGIVALLDAECQKLAQVAAPRGRRRRSAPASSCLCPVCAALEASMAEQIASGAALPALPSSAPCLPHLRRLTAAAEPSARREALILASLASIGGLVAELREYVHKSAWQNRDEPRGEEQTAWLRGARWFMGDRLARSPGGWRESTGQAAEAATAEEQSQGPA